MRAHTIGLIAILIVLGCSDKETIKSRAYWFEVTTGAPFSSKSSEAFMYNTDLATYSPARRGGTLFEGNTLYVLRHDHSGNQRSTDTLKIKLAREQVDSLYALAYSYLSAFEMDNEIEIGKPYDRFTDAGGIKVSLGYRGKLMECSLSFISREHQAAGPDKLIEFIDTKVPKEFRLY